MGKTISAAHTLAKNQFESFEQVAKRLAKGDFAEDSKKVLLESVCVKGKPATLAAYSRMAIAQKRTVQ